MNAEFGVRSAECGVRSRCTLNPEPFPMLYRMGSIDVNRDSWARLRFVKSMPALPVVDKGNGFVQRRNFCDSDAAMAMTDWEMVSTGLVAVSGSWMFLRLLGKNKYRRERILDVLHDRAMRDLRAKKMLEGPTEPAGEIVAEAAETATVAEPTPDG